MAIPRGEVSALVITVAAPVASSIRKSCAPALTRAAALDRQQCYSWCTLRGGPVGGRWTWIAILAAAAAGCEEPPAPAPPSSGPATRKLSVRIYGTGDGKVTSVPAGIDCGETCEASYPPGTTITLAAAAAAGSQFLGWSQACSGEGPCSVVMDVERAVFAVFEPAAAGGDGGPDAGPTDAAPPDAGPQDAGPVDAGPVDSGPVDSGPVDAGPIDAGPLDAGPVDSGPADAGPVAERCNGLDDDQNGIADEGTFGPSMQNVYGVGGAAAADRLLLIGSSTFRNVDGSTQVGEYARVAMDTGSLSPASEAIFDYWPYHPQEPFYGLLAAWSPAEGRFGALWDADPLFTGLVAFDSFSSAGEASTDYEILASFDGFPVAVAAGQARNWLACWLQNLDGVPGAELYCKTITGGPSHLGGTRRTVHTPAGGAVLGYGTARPLGSTGRYLAAWSVQEGTDALTAADLYFAQLDANGAPVTSPSRLVDSSRAALFASLAEGQTDQGIDFLTAIAWADRDMTTFQTTIRFARLSPVGMVGAPLDLSASPSAGAPMLTWTGSSYLAIWAEGTPDWRIFAAELSPGGGTLRAKWEIVGGVAGVDRWPLAVAVTPGALHLGYAWSNHTTQFWIETECIPR